MIGCARRRSLAVLPVLLVLAVQSPESLAAQDALSILQTMVDRQAERAESVDDYTIVKSVEAAGGLQAPQYFVKTMIEGQPTFRLVPAAIYEGEMMAAAGFPPPSPELYDGLAFAYDLLGPALEQGGGDQPAMPGATQMTSQISLMLREGAEAMRNLEDGTADAAQAVEDMQAFMAAARLEGTEQVLAHPDGTMRDAYLIVADGLARTQEVEGGTYTLESVRLWIDTEFYVPFRLVVDGEMSRGNDTTPLTIERLDLDYRVHGPLIVAHREVGRLSGIMEAMSDAQRAEMEEAREQLAEAEAQLAAMPDGPAKDMAMRMMGPQLEQARAMLDGGAFESAIVVASVAVNEGPPTPYGLGEISAQGVHGAMTYATESQGATGLTAELSVMSGLSGAAERTFSLLANGPYPEEGGSLVIVEASGQMPRADDSIPIDSGSGTLVVTDRTDTRIAGTFSAQLTGTDEDGNPVTMQVNGMFDSGAPAGPRQAPRGSPIPAMFAVPGG